MQTILVINSKGGCGKTTLATNIASFFANEGKKTAIMDYDPQGSSTHWLATRPKSLARIEGAHAAPKNGSLFRSWHMMLPRNIEKLIIDPPAGVTGLMLQDLVRRCNCIVIPVAPSSIDIHATADFIKDLLLIGKARTYNKHIAVIGNRLRSNTPIYQPLEKFVSALDMPFVAQVKDSMKYIEAAEQGMGIFDTNINEVREEFAQMSPLFDWLGNYGINKSAQTGPSYSAKHTRTIFAA